MTQVWVRYKDGRIDIVNKNTLDDLLSLNEIGQFYRMSESRWITPGIQPTRGDGGYYNGPERREKAGTEYMERVPPNILLINYDPLVLEMTRTALQRIGYQCIAAGSAEEGRNLFLDNPQRFDLVLADSDYDSMLADFLRLRPDMPVVLYTGIPVDTEHMRSKGFSSVLRKPLTQEEFAEALKRIIPFPSLS